jgi:hypothetical protein
MTRLASLALEHPGNLRTINRYEPHPALPGARVIFSEEWWLDAASDGRWEQVEAGDRCGPHAVLPFVRERRFGATRLVMPLYTRTLGPIFSLPPSKPVTRLDNMRALAGDLIGRLPRFNLFLQTLSPEAEDTALAFALNGWRTETEYSFRIPATVPGEDAWAAMSQKTRNLIRTSERRFAVEWHGDVGRLVALSRRRFAAERTTDLHRYSIMTRTFEAALVRGCAAVASALNDRRQEVAAVAVVWDAGTLYFWNTARDVEASGSGALSLLVWEVCKAARARGLAMDFDGFASPAAGRFIAAFGGIPVPRPVVVEKGIWSSTISLVGSLTSRATKRLVTGRCGGA